MNSFRSSVLRMTGFRFPLKVKFGLLLAGFVAAMAIVIYMSYTTARQVTAELREVELSAFQQYTEAFHLIDYFQDISALLDKAARTKDRSLIDKCEQEKVIFLAHAEKLVHAAPEPERPRLSRLTEDFNGYYAAAIEHTKRVIEAERISPQFRRAYGEETAARAQAASAFEKALVGDLNRLTISGGQQVAMSLSSTARAAQVQWLKAFVTGVAAFVLLLVVLTFLIRRIVGPIKTLSLRAAEVAKGNLNQKIEIPSSVTDEIGDLVGSFNLMTEGLIKTTVSKRYVDNIIRSMMDTLVIVNPDGTIRSVNQATLDLLGYQERDLVGNPLGSLLVDEADGRTSLEQAGASEGSPGKSLSGQSCPDQPPQDQPITGLPVAGVPETFVERVYIAKDGRRIPVSFSSSVMVNDDGTVEGIVCVAQDITERKSAELELKTAKDSAEWANCELTDTNRHLEEATKVAQDMTAQAKSANAAKSEFLAMMSHEIRTPLNGILGFSQLLLEDEVLNKEQRDFVETIYSSGAALVTVINDILDFSKIEAGRMDLEKIDFDLVSVVESIGDILKQRTDEKGIELSCFVDHRVPTRLWGDPGRLRQIMLNLAGNAVKFTEKGEVAVEAKLDAETQDTATIRFEIRDTGIGIPEDRQAVIFDKFTQVDGSTTRRYGGTGLGLAISKRLVEMMGGEIGVESEAGKGSMFYFIVEFPLQKGPAMKTMLAEIVDIEGLRVLIVDDNARSRQLLEEMLTPWHMRPKSVGGGEAALKEMEEAHRAGEPYVMGIIDGGMPEMDGFRLCEHIKSNKDLAGTVLILLTSGGRTGDGARCRELGIAAYLMKPIKQSDLWEAVMLTLGKRDRGAEQPLLVTQHTLRENRRSLHILVAEDSPVNVNLVVRMLEKRGHTLVVATNGREALIALEKDRFDLVLMDVQMPEVDGFEATAAIREKEKKSGGHIPIIAMTAHAMKGDRERCLETGMDGYVSKPIRAQELLEAVENIASGEVRPKVGVAGVRQDQDVIDWLGALAHLEGDVELLKEIAGMFVEQCPSLVSRVREAVAHRDPVEIERAAHTVKGSVGNFAAKAAFEAAMRLEQIGRNGPLDEAESACAKLEDELERLKPALVALGRDSQ